MVCLSRPYHFKFFKGYLPQVSLSPLLDTFSQMSIHGNFLEKWKITLTFHNLINFKLSLYDNLTEKHVAKETKTL